MAHDLNSLNPYLNGPFAPIADETQSGPLTVIGEIPKDFAGVYVRNGPNPKSPPKGMHHWFDGDGMLHGLSISNGEARYRNRYVRSRDLDDSGERGGSEGDHRARQHRPSGRHPADQSRSPLAQSAASSSAVSRGAREDPRRGSPY